MNFFFYLQKHVPVDRHLDQGLQHQRLDQTLRSQRINAHQPMQHTTAWMKPDALPSKLATHCYTIASKLKILSVDIYFFPLEWNSLEWNRQNFILNVLFSGVPTVTWVRDVNTKILTDLICVSIFNIWKKTVFCFFWKNPFLNVDFFFVCFSL